MYIIFHISHPSITKNRRPEGRLKTYLKVTDYSKLVQVMFQRETRSLLAVEEFEGERLVNLSSNEPLTFTSTLC